jgi:hypothetical protein
MAAALVGAVATALLACGSAQRADSTRFASLIIECPVDFVARVDDRPFPVMHHPIAGSMLRLPAGEHRLELQAEGFLSYRTDLSLLPGATYDLRLELWPVIPELDGLDSQ